MSNDDASFNDFFKLLEDAVTRSQDITCPHNDGGYIHPLTAELVRNTISDHHKVTRSDTSYREAESRARSLIDMFGAMAGRARSLTVSDPNLLPYLQKVLDDLCEQDRECVQRRQSLVMSLGSARDRLKWQQSLCEHLSEEYKVPEYPPPEPATDKSTQLLLSTMIDSIDEEVTAAATETSKQG
jgi:hypothetical protein